MVVYLYSVFFFEKNYFFLTLTFRNWRVVSIFGCILNGSLFLVFIDLLSTLMGLFCYDTVGEIVFRLVLLGLFSWLSLVVFLLWMLVAESWFAELFTPFDVFTPGYVLHLWGVFLIGFSYVFWSCRLAFLFFFWYCLCCWLLCIFKIVGGCLFNFMTFLPLLGVFWKWCLLIEDLCFFSSVGCWWNRFSLSGRSYPWGGGSSSFLILFSVLWIIRFFCFCCRWLFCMLVFVDY